MLGTWLVRKILQLPRALHSRTSLRWPCSLWSENCSARARDSKYSCASPGDGRPKAKRMIAAPIAGILIDTNSTGLRGPGAPQTKSYRDTTAGHYTSFSQLYVLRRFCGHRYSPQAVFLTHLPGRYRSSSPTMKIGYRGSKCPPGRVVKQRDDYWYPKTEIHGLGSNVRDGTERGPVQWIPRRNHGHHVTEAGLSRTDVLIGQRNPCRYSVESLNSLFSSWTYGRAIVLTNRSTACPTIRPMSSIFYRCP